MSRARCPVHGKLPVLVYSCCIGALGGRAKSAAKAAAVRENGKKGGRPRLTPDVRIFREHYQSKRSPGR